MKIIIPTISLYLYFLFACSHISAQEHQLADEYRHKAQDLEKRGLYLEAAKLYERSVQAERESPDPRKSNLVTELNLTGNCYFLIGQYGEAVKYFEEAMAIAKKLGEEDKVANCLNYFGLVYNSVGQHDTAITYYEKAKDIDNKLGMQDKIAMRLNNIGEAYRSWEKYDKAIEYLEEALEIHKNLGMKGRVAARLNSIGEIYHSRGQYEKANEFYEKALAIERELPHEEKVTTSLNNLGRVYEVQDQYEKANEYYEEALTIHRELKQEDKVVTYLNNLGRVSEIRRQYEKAVYYYEAALDINRELGKEDTVDTSLNNLGRVCEILGQYEKAIYYYEGALAVSRGLKREDKVAVYLNALGSVCKTVDQYEKAIKCYEEALAINKKLGKEADDELTSKELDMVYTFYWNKHDKVIKPYEETLAIKRKLECYTHVFDTINNLGIVSLSQKKYKTSIKFFLESLSIIEKICKTTKFKLATREIRQDYVTHQLNIYQWLVNAYIKDNDIFSAIQIVERSRATIQADRFSIKKRLMRLPEVKQIQETLEEDTIILLYAYVNEKDFLLFSLTREEILCKEVSCRPFIRSILDTYDAPIEAFVISQRNLGGNKSTLDNSINYYGSLLRVPPSQNENTLKTNLNTLKKDSHANTRKIGRDLYELLIRPMETQMKDKKNLIIIPDGILASVPFETLLDDNGQYLVEDYNIRYLQSLYIRELIKERKYSEKRRPVLAFGGAIYNEGPYEVDVIENDVQLSFFKKGLYSDLENELPVRNAYGALDIGPWLNLPDTLNEVNNIKRVVNESNFFTGRNVTERHIKELSRNGTLGNYKVLHFATYALVVPEVPELSALVLSQFEKEVENEDGYLRMGEIVKLDLQADLINLSACETALGNVFGSEGFTELTQSFLLAGAKAVSVSLWRVSDESTSMFIVTMFEMVQNQDISYANAITEVKRQFISGYFGEKYKSPYYWAPFVYYGN